LRFAMVLLKIGACKSLSELQRIGDEHIGKGVACSLERLSAILWEQARTSTRMVYRLAAHTCAG
jgi:hypothetical protein